MKTINKVQLTRDIEDFVTDKEVNSELVLDYIKKEKSGFYNNLRLVPHKECSDLDIIVYGEYERISFIVTEINFV